ncbi:hypothetical protein ACOME3_000018 [Neoechinorhynchus agilis]
MKEHNSMAVTSEGGKRKFEKSKSILLENKLLISVNHPHDQAKQTRFLKKAITMVQKRENVKFDQFKGRKTPSKCEQLNNPINGNVQWITICCHDNAKAYYQ